MPPHPEFSYDPAIERLTPGEIAALRNRLLREQLIYCQTHSPFYAEAFRGMDFSGFTADDLKNLPFTDKALLTEHNKDFLCVPMEEIEEIAFSSGTTGKPCPIFYSSADMRRLAYNEHRSLILTGLTKRDTVLLTCTLDRCFIAGVAYYLGVRSIGATALRNGLTTIESHLDIIKGLRPTAIIGVPSFLRNLGAALLERGGNPSVKRLICIGEPVRDESFGLSPLGRRLKELWGDVLVLSTYSSSEMVTSFCECTSGCGGHLPEDLGFVEIIGENGEPVPDGEPGELVFTHFQTTGMPLIRFRTGDITFKCTEPCACGRFSMRVGPVLGRKAHMLKCKGTTLYPRMIQSILDAAPEIADYYIVASGEGLSDSVEAVVALKNPSADLAPLAERLHSKCRVRIPVTVRDPEEVRKQIFSTSRKPVRFVDLRKKERES